MEEKQIVVSPQCPDHGWINTDGSRRAWRPVVGFIEYDSTDHYIIREENFEAAGLNA